MIGGRAAEHRDDTSAVDEDASGGVCGKRANGEQREAHRGNQARCDADDVEGGVGDELALRIDRERVRHASELSAARWRGQGALCDTMAERSLGAIRRPPAAAPPAAASAPVWSFPTASGR